MKRFYSVWVILAFGLTACLGGCWGDKTIAKVNGKAVKQSQFDAYLKLKNIPSGDAQRQKYVLDDYLEREALADLVQDNKFIDKTAAEAELNEFRKQMLISRYFENFLKDKVSDQAVTNFYNTHTSDFQSEQVKVAHILLRTNQAMSENELRAVQTRAHEVYSKLMAKADFAETAKQYSEDQVSARNGGSLGWIRKGSIDPVFSQKIFSMQQGEISQPFKTPYGYHIVRIEEGMKMIKVPLEKVKGDIRFRLRQQAKDAEMARLKKEMNIKVKT